MGVGRENSYYYKIDSISNLLNLIFRHLAIELHQISRVLPAQDPIT